MTQQLSTFSETEKKAMERYKWWPVYLVREKRRLEGITRAVQAGAAAAQAGDLPPTPEVLAAEEFLLRAGQEGEAAFPDPLTLLEDMNSEELQPAEANEAADVQLTKEDADTDEEYPDEASDDIISDDKPRRGNPAEGLAKAIALPDDEEPKTLW